MEFDRIARAYALAAVSAAAFVALSVTVSAGSWQQQDDRIRQLFRPDGVWSTNQLIFGNVVDGLGPPVAVTLLGLAGLVAAVRERSLRPLVRVGLLAFLAALLTVLSKLILHRPDPGGDVSANGGAFPSGHMVMLIVSLAGCLLVLRGRLRWWESFGVAVVAATMAASLLFLAMHWFTDLVGGALLAIPVVALAAAWWPSRDQGPVAGRKPLRPVSSARSE